MMIYSGCLEKSLSYCFLYVSDAGTAAALAVICAASITALCSKYDEVPKTMLNARASDITRFFIFILLILFDLPFDRQKPCLLYHIDKVISSPFFACAGSRLTDTQRCGIINVTLKLPRGIRRSSMLDFRPITLEDKERIERYSFRYAQRSCQHTFVSMYAHFGKYGDSYAEKDGRLYICRTRLGTDRQKVYLFPMGDMPDVQGLRTAINELLADASREGKRAVLYTITVLRGKGLL